MYLSIYVCMYRRDAWILLGHVFRGVREKSGVITRGSDLNNMFLCSVYMMPYDGFVCLSTLHMAMGI